MTANLPRDQRRFARWAVFFRYLSRPFCRTRHTLAAPVDTRGRPVVVVANHRSFFDLPVGFDLLERLELRPRILVRAKYFDVPLVGCFLRSAGFISAGTGWRATIDEAVRTLAAGRPVGLMVEGRIVPPDERDESGLGKVRRGFTQIARAADAVVLPVTLVGSDDVWPSTGRFPRIRFWNRPLVQIHVGEVIDIDDMSNGEALAAVRAALASHIALLS